MKVTVLGAGAVGSLLGAILARAHDVTLVGRDPHMAAVAREGLVVDADAPFRARIAARTNVSGAPAPDLVLFTVKTYDTPSALEDASVLMGPETILLIAQNGLGNWELARERFPAATVLGASVVIGATLTRPGHVKWSGAGEITIGGTSADAAAAEKVAAEFNRVGLKANTTSNLLGALWLKAIVNAAINPLTAIQRVPNGRLVEDPALKAQMRTACDEATRVARADGVELPVPDPWAVVERIATQTAANRSSMLQSVERGQRTEIDGINGRILEAARRHGIPCPMNEELVRRVKALEPAARNR